MLQVSSASPVLAVRAAPPLPILSASPLNGQPASPFLKPTELLLAPPVGPRPEPTAPRAAHPTPWLRPLGNAPWPPRRAGGKAQGPCRSTGPVVAPGARRCDEALKHTRTAMVSPTVADLSLVTCPSKTQPQMFEQHPGCKRGWRCCPRPVPPHSRKQDFLS